MPISDEQRTQTFEALGLEVCGRCRCCSVSREWTDCLECGGEGGFDAYEEDPIWYEPGDLAPCGLCAGMGGWSRALCSCDDNGKHAPSSPSPGGEG